MLLSIFQVWDFSYSYILFFFWIMWNPNWAVISFFSLSFFTDIATWIKFEAMSKVRDRTEDFKDSVRRAALDLGYNEVLLLHVHLYFLDNFNRHCMYVSQLLIFNFWSTLQKPLKSLCIHCRYLMHVNAFSCYWY